MNSLLLTILEKKLKKIAKNWQKMAKIRKNGVFLAISAFRRIDRNFGRTISADFDRNFGRNFGFGRTLPLG